MYFSSDTVCLGTYKAGITTTSVLHKQHINNRHRRFHPYMALIFVMNISKILCLTLDPLKSEKDTAFKSLISSFLRVLYVVCFLLGNTPASEVYMPTFRNTLFHPHRQVDVSGMKLG